MCIRDRGKKLLCSTADFINWAKDHDIPVGPGRGSAAGSLVAYAMKITNIDPDVYKRQPVYGSGPPQGSVFQFS